MAHLQSITQQRPACRPEAHFEESTTPDSLADSASTSDLYARQRQSALLLSQGSPSEQLTQQDNHSSGSCSAADSTATFSPALLGSCSDLIPLLCQSESLVNLMQFRCAQAPEPALFASDSSSVCLPGFAASPPYHLLLFLG